MQSNGPLGSERPDASACADAGDITADGVDLSACAEGYLTAIGLSGDEIASLKANPARSYVE